MSEQRLPEDVFPDKTRSLPFAKGREHKGEFALFTFS
jgi:hypothetical protein